MNRLRIRDLGDVPGDRPGEQPDRSAPAAVIGRRCARRFSAKNGVF